MIMKWSVGKIRMKDEYLTLQVYLISESAAMSNNDSKFMCLPFPHIWTLI